MKSWLEASDEQKAEIYYLWTEVEELARTMGESVSLAQCVIQLLRNHRKRLNDRVCRKDQKMFDL